jgi:hypothetical protein
LDRRVSPVCWTRSLARRSAPGHTVRICYRRTGSFSEAAERSLPGEREAARLDPLCLGPPRERRRSRAGVLRPRPDCLTRRRRSRLPPPGG